MSADEQERLKKLRNKQLTARDPLTKERQFQHSSSIKEKRMKKSFSLAKEWADVPRVIKLPLYALVLGGAALFILPRLWLSKWAIVVAGGLTITLIIFGVIVGNALDLRDEIKKQIK